MAVLRGGQEFPRHQPEGVFGAVLTRAALRGKGWREDGAFDRGHPEGSVILKVSPSGRVPPTECDTHHS